MAQNDKKLCRALYLRNHTSYDLHLWYTWVKGYVQGFLQFLQILIFEVISGVKGQKMAENN